jgi:membrane protease YdiL (CAAX protease family)
VRFWARLAGAGSVVCAAVTRSWSVVDFILIMAGGLLGSAVFAAIGIVVDDDELFVVMALAGQYVGHLFVYWLINRSMPPNSIGLEVQGRDSVYVVAGIGLQLALSILFLPLVLLLFPDGGPAQEIGSVISELTSTAARVSSIFISVVLAPITEEIAFRGVLIKALGDRSRRTLILVSATVFSLFHILGLATGDFARAAAVVLPQLFIVGVVLAWVTLRSKRLGPAIFLHSGFNLLASLVLLLPPDLIE